MHRASATGRGAQGIERGRLCRRAHRSAHEKGMQGIELLAEIKQRYPDIRVILMTAFGTVETAVDACAMGRATISPNR